MALLMKLFNYLKKIYLWVAGIDPVEEPARAPPPPGHVVLTPTQQVVADNYQNEQLMAGLKETTYKCDDKILHFRTVITTLFATFVASLNLRISGATMCSQKHGVTTVFFIIVFLVLLGLAKSAYMYQYMVAEKKKVLKKAYKEKRSAMGLPEDWTLDVGCVDNQWCLLHWPIQWGGVVVLLIAVAFLTNSLSLASCA